MSSPQKSSSSLAAVEALPASRGSALRVGYIVADRGIPVFGRKGASIHVQAMVGALSEIGHEVEILAAVVGDSANTLEARCIEVPAHDDSSPRLDGDRSEQLAKERRCLTLGESMFQSILDRHRERAFDFLYERYSLWSAAGVRAARRLGIPCVVEVNAPLVFEQKNYRRLQLEAEAYRIEREVFLGADTLIAVSEVVKSYALSRGAVEERVFIAPNGVDTERFRPEVPPVQLAPTEDRFVIGFVGSLKDWHDVGTLLDAVKTLVREAPDYHLLIVGDGPLRRWIEGYIRGAGLEGHVTVTGWVSYEDMPGFVNRFDVAVAPYGRMQGFYFSPLKLYEYLAAGRAVIASDVGQVGDVIADGESGVLVTPGDAEELAAGIRELRADPQHREGLGRAAREFALGRTWLRTAENVVALALPQDGET